MIRSMTPSVSLLAVCLIAVGASAQVTAKLTYADFTNPSDQLSGFVFLRRFLEPLPRAQLEGVPEDIGADAACFAVEIGEVPIRILVDPVKTPILYVDTDADLDFADEQAVRPAEGGEPWTVFLGLPAVAVGDRQVRFAARAFINLAGPPAVRYPFVFPAGACSGTVTFGDTEYPVALLDADLDGRYTVGADLLAIDANGDGRFEPEVLEVMPLAEMMRVGDVFYALEVKADGSLITFTETEPKLGALKVDSEAVQVGLASCSGAFLLSPSERDDTGAWSVPVGTHTLRCVNLVAQDESGVRWTLHGFRLPEAKEFEITGGETLELVLGPPVTLKPTVTVERGTVWVTADLVGRAGETYRGLYKDDEEARPPTLRILDEKGKRLASGALKYG
jgi:hypothetical protein